MGMGEGLELNFKIFNSNLKSDVVFGIRLEMLMCVHFDNCRVLRGKICFCLNIRKGRRTDYYGVHFLVEINHPRYLIEGFL